MRQCMSVIRDRAKNNFPMVLLTLLSIVQALALELLWEQLHLHSELYELTFASIMGWMQVTATLIGILLIWLSYATNAMRFRWVPSASDSVFPFFIGIVQFIMIDNLGVTTLGVWMMCLASIFAAMTWISHHDLRRARRDPENDEFFVGVKPATLSDHVPAIFAILLLGFIGLLLYLTSYSGWFSLAAVSFALVMLCFQMYLTNKFWERSMSLKPQV